MSDWHVRIVSVVDLNISGWRGKPWGSARDLLHAHARWRCWCRWQLHSDVLVPDVWVQCLIFLKSLVGSIGDLDQVSGC